MRVVIALGGNALLRRGEPMDIELQRANLKVAAAAIAEIAEEHQVVITHGNGPQVGLLALQNEAYTEARPRRPSTCSTPRPRAWSATCWSRSWVTTSRAAGWRRSSRRWSSIPTIPAFLHPTKPIGPVYDADRVDELDARRGWVTCDPMVTGGAASSPHHVRIGSWRSRRSGCS